MTSIQHPTHLTLPLLELPRERLSIGEIRHVLESGKKVEVRDVQPVRVSPRRSESLYSLSDGQKVVVTDRRNINLPDGVDGVLRVTDSGDPEWLQHRRVAELQNEIERHGWAQLRNRVQEAWSEAFRFSAESKTDEGDVLSPGLRPPQIGALHAIGAHWSLYKQAATVVIPTGVGKTETMLAALVAFTPGPMLVVVPSRALRGQTARKFLTLGLLRALGNLDDGAPNPIVGIVRHRPRAPEDLEIFKRCNVVVGTMGSLAQGTATRFLPELATEIDALIVDEAHHVAARTWIEFRDHFADRRVLQFTATPYRRDGKLVDGRVIYSYPLRAAQQDGYFKPIAFQPVYELDPEESDREVAAAAVSQLQGDIEAGLDHLLLARCSSITRAEAVHELYAEIAPEHAPVLVHSELGDARSSLRRLRRRESRIVVCVDMLGEGFDLPQLKIAAIHDTHKSLAVLLQFTGRFTRVAGSEIGEATVLANIANQDVSFALERLYSEDADWNHLLSEFSSDAVQQHRALVEFLNDSVRLGDPEAEETHEISHQLLRPKFSTAVFRAAAFSPKEFFQAISRYTEVHRVWLHEDSGTLYFVTRTEPSVGWSRSRELTDRQWDLFVLHHDADRELLYVHSSDKSSMHERLAKACGASELLRGDVVFRALGHITRLRLHNVGVRKYGRRNLRYALYTGSDVAVALSMTEKSGSVKSNLFGTGWENGTPANVGCSLKGRVWSRRQGTVPEFVQWCRSVGAKLVDSSIDTTKIIDNVLIPIEAEQLPEARVLSIDWPDELLVQSEERVLLRWDASEASLALFGIEFVSAAEDRRSLRFGVASDEVEGQFLLRIGGEAGFTVTQESGPELLMQVGKLELPLAAYLSDYPPLVKFLDLSELDGNLLVQPKDIGDLRFPKERFEVWDWEGTDLQRESIWKGEERREASIQERVALHYAKGGFDLIFDDDGPGEAADLVCLREDDEAIRLALVHCKFSGTDTPGARVADVEEVCSQAIRSAKWTWRFRDLCRHVLTREKRLSKPYRPTRFLQGGAHDLNRYLRASRFKEVRAEIVVAQPGVARDDHSAQQAVVLAAAHSFLKETVGIDLDVICSP